MCDMEVSAAMCKEHECIDYPGGAMCTCDAGQEMVGRLCKGDCPAHFSVNHTPTFWHFLFLLCIPGVEPSALWTRVHERYCHSPCLGASECGLEYNSLEFGCVCPAGLYHEDSICTSECFFIRDVICLVFIRIPVSFWLGKNILETDINLGKFWEHAQMEYLVKSCHISGYFPIPNSHPSFM